MDRNLGELRETVRDREAWCAAVHGLQRLRHDWLTERQQRVCMGFPSGPAVTNLPACRHRRRQVFLHWVGTVPWRRARQPTPAFLPGKPHGQRSLAGDSPYGCKELDTAVVTYTVV